MEKDKGREAIWERRKERTGTMVLMEVHVGVSKAYLTRGKSTTRLVDGFLSKTLEDRNTIFVEDIKSRPNKS